MRPSRAYSQSPVDAVEIAMIRPDGNSVIAAVFAIAATTMMLAMLFVGPQSLPHDEAVQSLAQAYGVTLVD